jgi:hypothetical protein
MNVNLKEKIAQIAVVQLAWTRDIKPNYRRENDDSILLFSRSRL